jgi:histone-lysine N-methyltransferase SETMAR
VARFSSGDGEVKDKPHFGLPCTAVTPRNEERLNQLIRANRWITTRELCMELNFGFNALEIMVATLEYLLQHDNTRLQTSLKTVEHIINIGWTVIPHPPYSLDLAPSDFHLFGPMKDGLRGQHFRSNDAVI